MKPQTLRELEQSIGGRPGTNRSKVRLSLYLSQAEADLLKARAQREDQSVSQTIRSIIKHHLTML